MTTIGKFPGVPANFCPFPCPVNQNVSYYL